MSYTLPHALRSPLAAATIAAVGAAAVITTPPGVSDRSRAALIAPSTARVALAAWQNPIVALLDSGELAENYVFGRYYDGGDAPTPRAGEANWPYAGFDQIGGDLLNYLLSTRPELGYYFYVGFLPNFTAEAYLPAVQQLQLNVEDYVSVVLSGLNLAARELATGVWDLPSAALDAVQLALQGQFSQALTVISDAIIAPIVAAGQSVLDAATYVVSNVVAKAGAVIAALPQILTTFAGWAVGSVPIVAQQTVAIVTSLVSNLSTLNVEGAWNTAVDGLLGPSGLPGTLLNLITGAGVQTGPIVDPVTDIPANFVPSFRTAFQAAQWTVRGALETTAATAAATAPRADRRAKVAPAAAAVGETPTAAADSATSVDRGAVSADRGAGNRDRAGRSPADRADRDSRGTRS